MCQLGMMKSRIRNAPRERFGLPEDIAWQSLVSSEERLGTFYAHACPRFREYPMAASKTPLDVIQIQNPCPASWEEMAGDARVRFCNHCTRNVYNLSDMTRQEAEALLEHREGRLCVRYYQRTDGGVITRDCKGGLGRRMIRAATFAASASLALLVSTLSAAGMSFGSNPSPDGSIDLSPSKGWARLFVHPPAQNCAMMGKMIVRQNVQPAAATHMGEVAPRAIMGDVALPAPATQPAT